MLLLEVFIGLLCGFLTTIVLKAKLGAKVIAARSGGAHLHIDP